MFIGHFALGFAAKKWAPTISLGTAFVAVQFADLAWPLLVLAGIERFEVAPGDTAFTPLHFTHYPYSHSLVALALSGLAFGGAYALVRHAAAKTILLLAALVLSHWLLDFLTHAPDMPLSVGGGTKVGLGLWNSVPGTLLVEVSLFVAGVVLYARSTVAIDRTGRYAFYGLVAFLALVYAANVLGPPPPSTEAVTYSALAMWLLVAWGYWIDRHRRSA